MNKFFVQSGKKNDSDTKSWKRNRQFCCNTTYTCLKIIALCKIMHEKPQGL